MQWGCVFDEASGDAFAFIVRDSDLLNKQIRYDRPFIEVNYFPPKVLAAGESITLPEVEILVYEGDWKKAADFTTCVLGQRAGRKVNPRCLLTTEAGPDFYARYFDKCLTQQGISHNHKVAVSRDVSPMRIAVPEYCVLVHSPCGPVAAFETDASWFLAFWPILEACRFRTSMCLRR